MSFLIKNPLTSALIAAILSLLLYIGYLHLFVINSLESDKAALNSSITELTDDLNTTTRAHNDCMATNIDLNEDVSRYQDVISKTNNLCNDKITKYKLLLEDCNKKYEDKNATVIVESCEVKISYPALNTIKILNGIGQ